MEDESASRDLVQRGLWRDRDHILIVSGVWFWGWGVIAVVPSNPASPPPAPPSTKSSSHPYSVSAILSPLALAASTKVSSLFSTAHLSPLSVALHCNTLQATLLHAPPPPPPPPPTQAEVKGGFGGYQVKEAEGDARPTQELLRLCVVDLDAQLKKMQFSAINLDVWFLPVAVAVVFIFLLLFLSCCCCFCLFVVVVVVAGEW